MCRLFYSEMDRATLKRCEICTWSIHGKNEQAVTAPKDNIATVCSKLEDHRPNLRNMSGLKPPEMASERARTLHSGGSTMNYCLMARQVQVTRGTSKATHTASSVVHSPYCTLLQSGFVGAEFPLRYQTAAAKQGNKAIRVDWRGRLALIERAFDHMVHFFLSFLPC